jgi:glycosyltransferase involved in cell wall biosynthesis
MRRPRLSVVVPLHNEEDNVFPLVEAIETALKDVDYEAVFVDDGSTDNTVKYLRKAANPRCRIVEFARNFGQTAAMSAGIDRARGEYIVTMDGDLQNDPADIPHMLALAEQGEADIIVGSRVERKDNFFHRTLPSRIANKMIRYITKLDVSDHGCSLKLFRADVAKRLELYGELHRFIAVLAYLDGSRVKEIPVRHHARKFGKTKYGLGRILRVASDMMLIFFLMRFLRRPMHLFGTLGVALLGTGGLIESYLLLLKAFGEDIGDRPLFFVGILCLMGGVQLITTGFLAELLMRTYYGNGKARTPYQVKGEYKAGTEGG